ncbi:MAG: tRNA preQ1(34) S-adenosylmethionine ribosyltransferase-isomerase QueA [Pseudomonadota bacterium]
MPPERSAPTLADYDYRLPPELIAQQPLAERTDSRLLVVRERALDHQSFASIGQHLEPGDLLVANDTAVINARLAVVKDTGGEGELLVERVLNDHECLAQVRVSKALQAGRHLTGAAGEIEVVERQGTFYRLRFAEPISEALEAHGQVPLPPYIERAPDAGDRERYQTVFARAPGAVAAPTAGLHFSAPLLAELADAGIERSTVTLHVGAGTFSPVRGDLETHRMHSERWSVTPEVVEAINACRARGGRIVAVGTTVVRTLETLAARLDLNNEDELPVDRYSGETDLFIRPGFAFRLIDRLITNFHLPQSTLMMLVCSFAGHQRVMEAYRTAVKERYRFFSYGDAMLLARAATAEAYP